MSACLITINKIKSFLEERKKKKHYPYYYIIKYNRENVRNSLYHRCYSYQDFVLFDELAKECKNNQNINILKMELKVYGKKYYFKSWNDLELFLSFIPLIKSK